MIERVLLVVASLDGKYTVLRVMEKKDSKINSELNPAKPCTCNFVYGDYSCGNSFCVRPIKLCKCPLMPGALQCVATLGCKNAVEY